MMCVGLAVFVFFITFIADGRDIYIARLVVYYVAADNFGLRFVTGRTVEALLRVDIVACLLLPEINPYFGVISAPFHVVHCSKMLRT